ncbi:MAG TPA: helix-turn-helix transcriptional regulator [Gemmatimonadaceae bacterium]
MTSRRPSRLPIGPCLRALRVEAGLSQEALADLAGVHRTFVGLVEQNRRHPRVDSVDRVLRALGVDWTEFGRRLDAARRGPGG